MIQAQTSTGCPVGTPDDAGRFAAPRAGAATVADAALAAGRRTTPMHGLPLSVHARANTLPGIDGDRLRAIARSRAPAHRGIGPLHTPPLLVSELLALVDSVED